MTSPPPSDESYAAELGAVLASRSVDTLRSFLSDSARRFGDDDQAAEIEAKPATEIETLLHHMTVARPDLARFHEESHDWLRSHGEGPRRAARPRPGRPPGKNPRRPTGQR